MLLDTTFLTTIFYGALAHAGLLFVAFLYRARSQFNDYERMPLRLPIEGLAVKKGCIGCTVGEFGEVYLTKDPCIQVKNVLRCHLTVLPLLRHLAITPGFFFAVSLVAYALSISQGSAVTEELQLVVISNGTLAIGVGAQLLYVIIKLAAGIPAHLQTQHPSYAAAAPIAVVLDLYPTLLGYKKMDAPVEMA
jgi:hypothetical protein